MEEATAWGRESIRLRLSRGCDGLDPGVPYRTPETPAAVLMGIVAGPAGPVVILTRRTSHLANHPGEISLPGGRIEPSDAGPAEAALRETFEEIGLAPGRVEILGRLPAYRTVSDYQVHPFVGWVEPPVEFVPDAHEVADVFTVPLSFILDPANHRCGSILHEGEERTFYVIPYPGYRIWGATAGMLVNLARTLAC